MKKYSYKSNDTWFFPGNAPPSPVNVQLDQCVQVHNSKVPMEITITSEQLDSYAFTGYSTATCEDATIVHPKTTELATPIILNKRKEVCSFKLGTTPWPEYPVSVIFLYENSITTKKTVDNLTCYTICNGSWESKYPFRVDILEKDGRVANNHVELFSGENCRDGTQIKLQNGANQVQHDTDLVGLTRINNAGFTHGFRITRK